MKKCLILMLSIGSFTFARAQSVGIGNPAPHASAMLDITSATKGLLAPRMTSIQRSAIVAPTKGLLVYDTDLNSLFHFNGTTWANVSGGGSFSLPYSASVNLGTPTFQIENAGSGDVLFLGASSGSAINAFNTGTSAAINVSATQGFGVYAQSFNSIPVFALSTNSNNALAAIRANNTGGGTGLHATSLNNDGLLSISSAANKVGVRGEATGTSGIGVYGTATSNTGIGVSGFHSGNGTGVLGTSTTGYGVRGVTSSGIGFSGVYGENMGTTGSGVRGVANFATGIGVSGSSTTGIGVGGFSESNRAIQGQTTSGTALYGSSTTGYALEADGKVKIAGGNTNPSVDAVLTCIDANGNAEWRPNPKIAFKARGIYSGFNVYPYGGGSGFQKLHLGNENYDYGNNFNLLTTSTPSANSSTFQVPVSGLYHFDFHSSIRNDPFDYFDQVAVSLSFSRGGGPGQSISSQQGSLMVSNGAGIESATLSLSTDVRLQAGDIVWIELFQFSAEPAAFEVVSTGTQFSGHLVFAD